MFLYLLPFLGLFVATWGALGTHPLDTKGDCDRLDPTWFLLKLGAAVGVVAAVTSFVCLFRRGESPDIVPLGVALACVLWFYGGGLVLNELLDGAPAVRYEHLLVVKKTSDASTPETASRVVTVQAPETPGCRETWRIGNVPGSPFGAIVPRKTTVTVVVKPGFFGFRWVKAVVLEKPSP